MSDIYFDSQVQALAAAELYANSKGYEVIYPNFIWTEHVSYGQTVKYHLPLKVERTGNLARQYLHISLYRMDSGNYELTHYLS